MSRLTGLTDAEAAARRARGEGNDVRIDSGRTYLEIVRENLFTVVNTLLLLIAGILVVLGLYGDALVTAVLVVVNVVVGVAQETRAKRSLDRLAVLTRPTATVVRDGVERVVDPREAVLGDLLVVRRGDQIVLDGRVVDGRMEVDESLLTGESDRIPKAVGDHVLSGSFCVSGVATYQAEKVGVASFANELTAGARAFREERTPLQRDVERLMRAIGIFVTLAAIPVAIAFWRLYGGLPPATEAARAAAVLVALVPQGLIVMITVTYALGAVRLAGGSALIQRSNAVEAMSRVDVLCLDKTGTLTTQQIELAEAEPLAVPPEELAETLGSFVASTSLATRSADAIRAAFPGEARAFTEEVPFASELRWSGARFADGPRPGLYVLGAPEVLRPHLAAGSWLATLDARLGQWASQGLRVMVFARRADGSLRDEGGKPSLPEGLEPLGVIGLREQLRADAPATLAQFRQAGVGLKLISGDNPETVAALSTQVGLEHRNAVVSGLDLASLDDAALARAASAATVFGRVPPALKARLVAGLRANGHYVAMIGDGVNDVLSLKRAQLGIAMQSGSQATRAVADIVLMGDRFGALPPAVVEGQRIITGMHDSIHLFLARAFSVALLIAGAAVVGLQFPITPRHNTVLAIVTVGIPALFLAVWAHPGRPVRASLERILRRTLPASVAMALMALPIYWLFLRDTDVAAARTAVTTFMTFCGLGLIPLLEPPTGDPDRDGHTDVRPTVLAVLLLLAFGALFAVPIAREFFELASLSLRDVGLLAALAVAWAVLVVVFWRVRLFDRVLGVARRAPD